MLHDFGIKKFQVQSSFSHAIYKIIFCGDKSICNGGFVCDNEINYGTEKSVYFNYAEKSVHFTFNDGSQCEYSGVLAQSSFTIICDEGKNSSTPFVRHVCSTLIF